MRLIMNRVIIPVQVLWFVGCVVCCFYIGARGTVKIQIDKKEEMLHASPQLNLKNTPKTII